MEINFKKTVYSRAEVIEIAIFWFLTTTVLLCLLIDARIELSKLSIAHTGEISSYHQKVSELERQLHVMNLDEESQCNLRIIADQIAITCENDEISIQLKNAFDQYQFNQVRLHRYTEKEVADFNINTTQNIKEILTIYPQRTQSRESLEAAAFRKFVDEMDHDKYSIFYKGSWCATISPELIQQIDLRVLCGEKVGSKSQAAPKPKPQNKSGWKEL
ncbi:hypothetical protein IT409_01350 [Candidatus Falkowbacteria bacterium]|nr:hypothetical protein [Candidatus Falkowbacteria bacterium]